MFIRWSFRKNFIFILLLILLFTFNVFAKLRIVIDPGHGGKDIGASRGNVNESILVLKVSKYLNDFLKKDSLFKVKMTRTTNKKVLSLSQREDIAKKFKADIFLSIHVNTNINSRVQGVEFYFKNQLPPDKEELLLANRENNYLVNFSKMKKNKRSKKTIYNGDVLNIIQDLNSQYVMKSSKMLSVFLFDNWKGLKHRQYSTIRQAPFYLVTNTEITSVLVELGYITNDFEKKQLCKRSYQYKIAESLYVGLKKFSELIVDKSQKISLNYLHEK